MVGKSGRWQYLVYQCAPMQWTDNGFCKGKNDQNAMWLQLGDGLANLQAFMTRFGDAVSEHGHAITDSMQHFYDLLHPVHLEDNTPAWSIIIGAVLAGISDGFAKSPVRSGSLGIASAVFGVITGTITSLGSPDDKSVPRSSFVLENSLNTSQTGDDREEKMAKVFLTINDELNKFTAKVIEDVHSAPPKTKEHHYGTYEYSAVNVLRGGAFADAIATDVTIKKDGSSYGPKSA